MDGMGRCVAGVHDMHEQDENAPARVSDPRRTRTARSNLAGWVLAAGSSPLLDLR